ncbi:MAG: hypothetical protein ABDH32_03025 [Candidatus Caldarchaeales archaeon]
MEKTVSTGLSVEDLSSLIGVNPDRIVSMSIHGSPPPSLGATLNYLKLLVVLRGKDVKMRMVNRRVKDLRVSTTIVEESLFRRDCLDEELGGATSHLLLIPYNPLIGEDYLKTMELNYFRHIITESLRNLVLDYRLSSILIVFTSKYILYDKLKRISMIYPPSRAHIRYLTDEGIESISKKLEKVLDSLVYEGLLDRHGSGYSPSRKLVENILTGKTFIKTAEELEHIFRLYVSTKHNILLDFIKNVNINLSTLTNLKIPDVEDYLYTKTRLGLQPLSTRLTIEDFVKNLIGVDDDNVMVKRFGGILNATYTAEFLKDGRAEKIFIKKYLNWSDFKWVAAWLWALGVKNFSVLASTRMSNEIFFINKLAELGFNTAEVLHINWKRKMLFQKFIEGENTIQFIKSLGLDRVGEVAVRLGKLIAELHQNDITMGDCNPFSFLFTRDGEIYLTDLEQCSLKGLKPWDITELIFYTTHYLPDSRVEEFAYMLSRGYLENGGQIEDLRESTEQKYTRLLTPLTPIWVQSKAVKGIIRAISEKRSR